VSFLNRRRVHGYLIGGLTGLSIGLIIDSVDLEKVKERSDKLIELVATVSLVISSVAASYNEPRFTADSEEDRPTGSRSDPPSLPGEY
jgi:hypothetical protein